MIVHRKQLPRRFAIERLEERALLTIFDLAAITGRVYRDLNGNGFNSGEEVSGARIELYRDDANGVLDSGDTLVGETTTNAEGDYRFDQLTTGTYFVRQPTQAAGENGLLESVSGPIVFSPADVQGVRGISIDSFDQSTHFAFATPSQPNGISVVSAPEAIGGSRKLEVSVSDTDGGLALSANTATNGPGVLDFHETGLGGLHRVTWDGTTPGQPGQATFNARGLGGVDLTDEGASTGLALFIGGDASGDQIQIVLNSSFTDVSIANVSIPNTGSRNASQLYPLSAIFIPFGDFISSGAGADFTDIGAIRTTWLNDNSRTNGQIDSISAAGPTLRAYDFNNQAEGETEFVDLELTMNASSPTMAGEVVFTITVKNVGDSVATNVAVTDQLPGGLSFVTSSSHNYSGQTGIWLVGQLDPGAQAMLSITAVLDTVTPVTNTAEISAADQEDVDSTPDNSDPAEDDQSSITVTPQNDEQLDIAIGIAQPIAELNSVAPPQQAQPILSTPAVFLFTSPTTTANGHRLVAYGSSQKLPDNVPFVSSQPGGRTLRLRFHELPEEQLQELLLTLAETVVADAEVADLADVQLARAPTKLSGLPQNYLEAPEKPFVESVAMWRWYSAAIACVALAGSLVVLARPKLVQQWFDRGRGHFVPELRKVGLRARRKITSVFAHTWW